MDTVTSLVAGYVRGAAQGALEAALAAQRTGVTDAQWWTAHAPILEKHFDPGRYPTLASVDLSGAFDQPVGDGEYFLHRALDDFEFGLQRMLDGIDAHFQRRSAHGDHRSPSK